MVSSTARHSEDEESLAGQKQASSQALGTIPKWRSSSRFIKRKKLDDELMESSLAKSSTRVKGASGVESGCCSGSETSSSEKKVSKAPSTPVPPSPATTLGLTKCVKKSKQPLQMTKNLGHWKPVDDLLVVNTVLQTNDLTSVQLGVKFSCHFTLWEVQECWYGQIYDPVISKLACQAMRQLHPKAIAAIQSKAENSC
ncbi:Microspherule protein 1 [Vulpes lagopus]